MKTVLLVEDSDADVLFMKRACRGADIPHTLKIVTDGQAAIDYLAGVKGYQDRALNPLPDLVFLDVNLPLRSGHDVLKWLRSKEAFKSLPVIILAESANSPDIERAHALGVTSYLVKNSDPLEFCEGIRLVLRFWLQMNQAPANP